MERTHDLKRLVTLAAGDAPDFSKWMDAAATLTPYATAYRYPAESAVMEPSRTEFDEALQLAEQMIAFVASLLPEDLRPA